MTWTQLFECFSNSDSKLEKVLLLSADGALRWLDLETASATGAAGRVRAVQVVTVDAASNRITWRVRLCRSGDLLGMSTLEASSLRRLRQAILTMSSSPAST